MKLNRPLLIAVSVLALAACGKKAPKDLPPPPATDSSAQTGTGTGTTTGAVKGSQEDFVASVSSDRIFFDTDQYDVDAQDQQTLQSQAAWLHSQMVRWDSLKFSAADAATARGVFRPDIYRRALAGTGAPLPGASAKVEGAILSQTGVGATQGRLMLGTDRFFDGRKFDPDEVEGYLEEIDPPRDGEGDRA